jgi:hypothetical protein
MQSSPPAASKRSQPAASAAPGARKHKDTCLCHCTADQLQCTAAASSAAALTSSAVPRRLTAASLLLPDPCCCCCCCVSPPVMSSCKSWLATWCCPAWLLPRTATAATSLATLRGSWEMEQPSTWGRCVQETFRAGKGRGVLQRWQHAVAAPTAAAESRLAAICM